MSAALARHAFLATPDTFASFLAAFCGGTLTRPEWTHAAHVAVAATNAVQVGPDVDATFAATREGILFLNGCLGIESTPTSGFHVTLTRFWTITINGFVAERGLATAYEAACAAV